MIHIIKWIRVVLKPVINENLIFWHVQPIIMYSKNMYFEDFTGFFF